MPGLTYIANWKMNFTCAQACSFVTTHYDELTTLAQGNTMILCPSYEALYPIAQQLTKGSINLGAQNCSAHHTGAHTGEVSAQSLRELGVTYCIAGHSEQRRQHHNANPIVAAQVEQLLLNQIIPIICIGQAEQYAEHKTRQVLLDQLDLVTDVLNKYAQDKPQVYIAYEPVWSIGTGNVAPITYLQEIFAWLAQTCPTLTTGVSYRLLYGGSVNENNARELKQITHLDGFLIGNASLDFKKFKNIVSC